MTYVLSDIHGYAEAFNDILEQIALSKDDRLFIVGDVIDRGPDGIALLKRIKDDPRMTLLTGNHEFMMLETFTAESADERRDAMENWFRNGGEVTYRSFMSLPLEERKDLLAYVARLPLEIDLTLNGEDYRLVHAMPGECIRNGENKRDKTLFCVWSRLDPEEVWLPDRTVIFGHTPTWYYGSARPLSIMRFDRKIAIDCGMASGPRYGRLACLRLEDQKTFYSS